MSTGIWDQKIGDLQLDKNFKPSKNTSQALEIMILNGQTPKSDRLAHQKRFQPQVSRKLNPIHSKLVPALMMPY